MRAKLLHTPHELGALHLPNRIVMAPMTRSRTLGPAFTPDSLTAEYYVQRASAGLIVSEGIAVSALARGYCRTPGLYTAEQERAWSEVTRAVHDKGGRIFAQLWHCGRISHVSVHPEAAPPVGAGTIRADSKTLGCDPASGKPQVVACSEPRSLTTEEAGRISAEFEDAARRAIAAGFDGVEIHAGDGYLLDQFRCPFLNHRLDHYGGSLDGRCRLLFEVSAAVAAAVGPSRTGVRISPLGIANDMRFDPNPELTYGHIAQQLSRDGLAYLHIADQDGRWIHLPHDPLLRRLRRMFSGTLILCGGFSAERADAALHAHSGDLIAFGRPYISNPDLVERLGEGVALAPYDSRSFYLNGESGYVDYPTRQPSSAAATGS